MNEKIMHEVDALDTELYLMRLALHRDNLEVVEHHASRVIDLAGTVRRECFLETHVSGEVK